MFYTLYTVHCILYSVHCTLYTVHCTYSTGDRTGQGQQFASEEIKSEDYERIEVINTQSVVNPKSRNTIQQKLNCFNKSSSFFVLFFLKNDLWLACSDNWDIIC